MRIAVASDHAGFPLNKEIVAHLFGEGHDVVDFGAPGSEAIDLPDTVYPAALAVGRGEADRGIFIDGVGYGRYRRRVAKVRAIADRHLIPLQQMP